MPPTLFFVKHRPSKQRCRLPNQYINDWPPYFHKQKRSCNSFLYFGDLQLRYPVKRRIQQAVIILDEHQIINVDDVRLMNLDKPGKAMHNLLGRHAPTQSQRRLVVQNHFPQLTF